VAVVGVVVSQGIAMYVDDVGFWVRILVPEDGTARLAGCVLGDL
jgi:hypothetical protein